MIMKQPLAYIHPEAKIADNVVIEPFVTIDKNVVIGAGSRIRSNAVILSGTRVSWSSDRSRTSRFEI